MEKGNGTVFFFFLSHLLVYWTFTPASVQDSVLSFPIVSFLTSVNSVSSPDNVSIIDRGLL